METHSETHAREFDFKGDLIPLKLLLPKHWYLFSIIDLRKMSKQNQ